MFLVRLAAVVALAAFLLAWPDSPAAPDAAAPRRPVALCAVGADLFVAQRSGGVSVLDADAGTVRREKAVGTRLADLVSLPDGRLLVVDEATNRLVVLSNRLEILHRVDVPAAPVSVVAVGTRAAVASLWGRSLTLVDLMGAEPRAVKTVALPFAPRRQLVLPGAAKVLVADAFGGRLAIMDIERGVLDSVREVPGHNVGGLALGADGKTVVVAQQVLSRLARTTRDDIHWGNLLANYLRVVPLAALLKPDADLTSASRLLPVGDFGHGTGDPSGLAVAADGTAVVALAGVGEVGVGVLGDDRVRYLRVGKRPTAVALAVDGRRAFVANTFDDSVAILDLKSRTLATTVRLGAARPTTAAERGEQLFFDARLTHDGWFSCHSCHTDGHSNGHLADTLGDGGYGAPKRVPTLLGIKDTKPYAWDGRMPDLATQLRQSVRSTMHGNDLNVEQLSDLTAYLESLPPPPPMKGDVAAVERGRRVFETRHCGTCHAPPTYTTPKTYDVGLKDEVGNKTFNPPSLRGIAQGGPFFHDGRAATLDEVLGKYRHPPQGAPAKEEVSDLIAFLRSL